MTTGDGWRRKAFALLVVAFGSASAAFLQRSHGTDNPVHAESRAVTWRADVGPLVYNNCSSCHHAGGSGPFTLMSFADAKRWGPQMVDVVASHYMPPWLPEPTGGPVPVHFEGERRLRPAQIEMLAAWVKAGMPEGTGPEPAAPHFAQGWAMGEPDLVLEMPKAVTEPASGSDIFVNFVLPANITGTRWVRAMEIQPGAGQLVHHANVLIDRTESLRAAHPDSWQAGVPGMDLKIDSGEAFDPDSHFLFWKPDSTALVEAPGMPWRLDPGNDLILNMHLKPTGKPEAVRARIGLYFTPKPATARPLLIQLEHDAVLNIPAGDANFVVADELKLPLGVDLLGIYPHAHYLGKEMEAWAVLPGGVRQPILLIKGWDIDRQAVYRLTKPLPLPAGTVLHMRFVYDNSAANVHNPHQPPVAVHSGNNATDEMSHLWLQVLPHGEGDARLPVERAWMEDILRKSPTDPIALYNLGALDQMAGKLEEAAALFRRLLVLAPGDGRAMTALGSALEASGDTAGARAQYKAALLLDAGNTDAAYDLATLDLHDGQSATAEGFFRQVLQRHPDDVAAEDGLGEALLTQDRNREAEGVLEGVLAHKENDPDAHRLLAMLYSAEGDLNKTMEHLNRWAALTPGQPDAHRALAQMLSAAGEQNEAVKEEKMALSLAGDNASDLNDLAVMQIRAGQKAEAKASFARALRLEPGNEAARKNLARLQAER